MSYHSKDLEKKSLEVIKANKLIFFKEISAFIGISRATLYNNNIDKLDSIRDAIEANRELIKAGLRKKWYESDNATVQIALYRLLADEDEIILLNSQQLHVNINGNISGIRFESDEVSQPETQQ